VGVLVIKLICKTCGFKGLVQTRPASVGSPPTRFIYTGEDVADMLRYRCPSCGEESPYTMDEIKGKFYRTKKALLYALLVCTMAIMIFRVIHTTFLQK
jgi:predicted RNA-binding Zn-ribbon protein involved in translation (DUF1610 family)